MSHADTLITHVTEASTAERAEAIVRQYKPSVIRAAADQLYIDPEGHGVAWLRRQVVTEARAGITDQPSCQASDHAAQLADFGDCSGCDAQLRRRLTQGTPSAAETPGTIASAQAFGWGA